MGKKLLLFSIIMAMLLSFIFGCSGPSKGPLGPLHPMGCSAPPPLAITITPNPGIMNQPVAIKISNISDKRLVEIQVLDSTGKRIRYYSSYDVSAPDRTGPVPLYSNKELTLTETFTSGSPGQWKITGKDLGGQTVEVSFKMDPAK